MASKGAIPWNKGLSKDTDKRVLKNANSRKGKGSEKTKQAHEKRRIEVLGVHYDLLNKPDQWKITCTGCKVKEIVYVRFKRFHTNLLTIESGKDVLCNSCHQTGRKPSDEAKLNMSTAAKTRKTDPVNEAIRSNKISEAGKLRYSKMSLRDRDELNKKIVHGQWNKPQSEIDEWLRKRSEKRKQEMLLLGQTDRFVPSYNVRTIPYIVDILNIRYNTQFQHAETETGEFKIYDKQENRFYYADAYSKELNLWIEFDESNKFYKEQLKSDHIYRCNRIKQILGCNVHRIHFNENYY